MTSLRLLAAASAALVAASALGPVAAGDHYQLIRSAGLTVEQARGMTLDEIAAHKFSREGTDAHQAIRPAPSAHTGPARAYFAASPTPATAARTLDDIYIEMINRSAGNDDRQTPNRR